jgi:hypothetical protein
LAVFQISGDKKEFSRREVAISNPEIAGETTKNRELSERGCFPSFIKIPFLDSEEAVTDQYFALRFD